MTLDASGNLGIGTTSPASYGKFAVSSLGTPTTAYASIMSGAGTYNGGFESTFYVGAARTDIVDNGVVVGWRLKTLNANASSGTYLSFESANSATGAFAPPTTFTERARIDSSGNFFVGNTSAANPCVGLFPAGNISTTVASGNCIQFWNQATTGDNGFATFYTDGGGGSLRGSITYNRAGGLVAYNVTSDYRSKDISGPVTNSGALIDSTPVYMGTMKGATQERPMFIAHETPVYAHTGEKDAVDADGNPVYQQMDASALIPVMWAEIQSLRQRVAQLESN
jgi:hypothetical protein